MAEDPDFRGLGGKASGAVAVAAKTGALAGVQAGIHMSDKAAKDYKKSTKNIAVAGKAGVYGMMAAMFGKMIEATGAASAIQDMLEILTSGVGLGFQEALEFLYDNLFTEENIQIMEDLGKAIGVTFGEKTITAIENLTWLGRTLNDIAKPIQEVIDKYPELKIALDYIAWFSQSMSGVGESHNPTLKEMIELYKMIGEELDILTPKVERFLKSLEFQSPTSRPPDEPDDDWWYWDPTTYT